MGKPDGKVAVITGATSGSLRRTQAGIEEQIMSTYVFVNTLQAKAGQQSDLIELLRDFAVSMHAEPGRLHYSVHRPIDDENGPVTVIQAYASREAHDEHNAWMSTQAAKLIPLLDSPPAPPVLLEQVVLSGHRRESFSPQTS